eukprot:1194618-Prorocentrum_minimum.AAC.1
MPWSRPGMSDLAPHLPLRSQSVDLRTPINNREMTVIVPGARGCTRSDSFTKFGHSPGTNTWNIHRLNPSPTPKWKKSLLPHLAHRTPGPTNGRHSSML